MTTIQCNNRHRNPGGRTCRAVTRLYFEYWCMPCCYRYDHECGKHANDPHEQCPLCHRTKTAAPKAPLRWKRSEDGYCDSHCGRWQVQPVYWGRVNPIGYRLWDARRRKHVGGEFDTQADAKHKAQRIEAGEA